MSIVILIIIGLLSAIIGSIVGIGGGIIIVPTLIYFGITQGILHHITPQTAIGTSSIILIATGLSSTLGYLKVKQVDIRNGLILIIGILPGAFIGAYLSRFLTMHSFNLYFGLFLILVSILLMIRYKIPPLKLCQKPKYMKTYIDGRGERHVYGVAPVIAVVAAFIIGLTSGLFWYRWRCAHDAIFAHCVSFPTSRCCRYEYDDHFLFKRCGLNWACHPRTCRLELRFNFNTV